MKTWNWPKFFLGCAAGILILILKNYWDNRVTTVDYPPMESEHVLEVEEISFPKPVGGAELSPTNY